MTDLFSLSYRKSATPDNGCRLGWLINRKKREVEIYRPGQEVEVLQSPLALSGEDVLPGFVLNLQKIWN